LSLITLKAELSRRIIGTDTERAGREIAELEAVARQSLSDVREAVAPRIPPPGNHPGQRPGVMMIR
jgi:signal transduction histidine kinase